MAKSLVDTFVYSVHVQEVRDVWWEKKVEAAFFSVECLLNCNYPVK